MITRMPVWIWLPDHVDPVLGAEFVHDDERGTGEWTYTAEYRARDDAYPIDPLQLTLSPRKVTTTKQDGWFGVIMDSAPGQFGLEMWRKKFGYTPTRAELIQRVPADGAGAILVGELSAERLAPPPSVAALQDRAAHLLSGGNRDAQDSAALITALQLSPVTGGAKPKLDVVDGAGAVCLAKFADRGDPASLPRIEAAAMTVARVCGIDVSEHWIETFCGEFGTRDALLQRRFDRRLFDGQIYRDAFASGFSVLNLSTGAEEKASYTALAHELSRWCARSADRHHATRQRRELWRRIAFNGLIGNGDDHTHNIGVLRRDGVWSLAPAFDLVPFDRSPTQPLASRMAYDKSGKLHQLSAQALIDAAPHYLWTAKEANEELSRMAQIVADRFEPTLRRWDVPESEIRIRLSAIGLARDIAAAQKAPPSACPSDFNELQ